MPKRSKEKQAIRDKAFIKLAVECDFNETEMARRLEVSPAAIQSRMKRIIKTDTFEELMEQHGLTDDFLLEKVAEGCRAQKVVGYLNNKVNGAEKVSDEFVEVPDMPTRHKYVITAFELMGKLKFNGKTNGNTQIIQIYYDYRNKDKTSAIRSGSAGRAELSEQNAG